MSADELAALRDTARVLDVSVSELVRSIPARVAGAEILAASVASQSWSESDESMPKRNFGPPQPTPQELDTLRAYAKTDPAAHNRIVLTAKLLGESHTNTQSRFARMRVKGITGPDGYTIADEFKELL